MENVKLELGFLDKGNKKFKISIDDPRENLEREDIQEAMSNLIENNIFISNGMDLAELDVARIIRTSIEEMEF